MKGEERSFTNAHTATVIGYRVALVASARPMAALHDRQAALQDHYQIDCGGNSSELNHADSVACPARQDGDCRRAILSTVAAQPPPPPRP